MPKPLTPDVLVYDIVTAGDAQIAPGGEMILYSLSKAEKGKTKSTSQLWLCDRDGSNKRQLTQNGQRNRNGRWSPDGTSIAFVSDRVSKAGLFVMPADASGEARELTHHNQELGALAWSPDGSQIAYTTTFDPQNPEEQERDKDAAPPVRVTRRIDYKFDGRGYLGDKRNQVFIVDVASGERRMLTSDTVDHNAPQWSPDGRTLAMSVGNANARGTQLGLVDVESGEAKLVTPEGGMVSTWAWSPSGDRVFFAADLHETAQADLFLYDVASDQVTQLTDDLPVAPAGGPMGEAFPAWLDDRRVLFNAAREGASGLYLFDTESRNLETVYRRESTLAGLSVDRARRLAVQGYSSLETTGEISVFDLQAEKQAVVTEYNEAVFEEYPPAQWERFEVQQGKYSVEAWLLKPFDFDPNKKYPVILDIHGGPAGHYGYAWNQRQELLANNGFLVVFANPRGSTSYGREFTVQVFKDWGGEDYKDLMTVLDTVLERPYADASGVGVAGYSYGGYMTAWIIGQTDRFGAAVCGAPCFDLESMVGTSDISYRTADRQWGGTPNTSPKGIEWYETHSPSTYAHRAKTPTLIVHGEADERCPIGQGEQMFVALKKANCEVEFARYPGGSHGFPRLGPPEHQVDFLQRTLDWFKSHLGDPQ